MNQTAVAVTSDTRSLLNALAATFTNNSSTVLGELLQNARRAGASKVEITATDETLAIVDDGRGIDDLSILLSIAKSGWDSEIQVNESPYGLGFISCLFAAQHITVASKGKLATAATADLLDLIPMTVQAGDIDGITSITLGGHKFGDLQKITLRLNGLVAGFPIPVFLNGVELARPHAIGNCELVQVSTGLVSPGVLEGAGIHRFYLQGLPIEEHFSSVRARSYGGGADLLCMHLDPVQFHGRMPDRNGLLEPEQSGKRISQSIKDAIRDHLNRRAAEMPQQDFIAQYADLAMTMGMLDLLNGIPFVPVRWLGKFVETPILSGETTDSRIGYGDLPPVVSREEIERQGIFACDEESEDLHAMLALHARGCIVRGRWLTAGHWLTAITKDVDDKDFTIEPGKVLGEGRVGVYGWSITVRLCEELHLISAVDHPSLAGRIPVDACCEEGILYITENASLSDTLKQLSNFEDDERFDEAAYDRAYDDLNAMLLTIKHNDPARLLQCYLDNGIRISTPEQLRGKSFTVAFNEEGVFTIAKAA